MDGDPPKVMHHFLDNRLEGMPDSVRKDPLIYSHGAGSHAEINALNEAMLANPNANIDNFLINVIRTGRDRSHPEGMLFIRCGHCEYITRDFKFISEGKK